MKRLIIIAALFCGCSAPTLQKTPVPLTFSKPENSEEFFHQWSVKNQGKKTYPTQAEVNAWERRCW